ncbi:MAG: hypothetical protein HC845_01880 [Akkermansiaceae bacterium]|nr:hypothetical protein [Akkermansiaceae bacterium]
MSESESSKETSARSPFAGCAIFIAAFAVMIFLIGFSVLTLFRQFGEIAKFTGEKPVPIEISLLDGKQEELKNLNARLQNFQQELEGEGATSLSLTAEELNLAIAAHDSFKELRGTFRVMEISGETLRIGISFPLNGKPRFARDGEPGWIASDSRYLNGTLIARPTLLKKEVVLSIDQIEVPGATVPPEFTDQMSPYRITERYLTDKIIGPAMAKLTGVSVAEGKITFRRKPGENPADSISKDQVNRSANRLFTALGIAACVFLAFVGFVVLIGSRAKARKNRDL